VIETSFFLTAAVPFFGGYIFCLDAVVATSLSRLHTFVLKSVDFFKLAKEISETRLNKTKDWWSILYVLCSLVKLLGLISCNEARDPSTLSERWSAGIPSPELPSALFHGIPDDNPMIFSPSKNDRWPSNLPGRLAHRAN
jgi:hypothetical protein